MVSPKLLIPSLAGGDEPPRIRRPFEWFRLLPVVQRDEIQNRLLEILEGSVDAVPSSAFAKIGDGAVHGRKEGPQTVDPETGHIRDANVGISPIALCGARSLQRYVEPQ